MGIFMIQGLLSLFSRAREQYREFVEQSRAIEYEHMHVNPFSFFRKIREVIMRDEPVIRLPQACHSESDASFLYRPSRTRHPESTQEPVLLSSPLPVRKIFLMRGKIEEAPRLLSAPKPQEAGG